MQNGSNYSGVAVEMDGTSSSGALSKEASSLREKEQELLESGQDKAESSTPISAVSASTHDTSRAKYHMKELGTFAKRLEEVSINSSYCFKVSTTLRFYVHRSCQ